MPRNPDVWYVLDEFFGRSEGTTSGGQLPNSFTWLSRTPIRPKSCKYVDDFEWDPGLIITVYFSILFGLTALLFFI